MFKGGTNIITNSGINFSKSHCIKRGIPFNPGRAMITISASIEIPLESGEIN
jgi:hypothetical protein